MILNYFFSVLLLVSFQFVQAQDLWTVKKQIFESMPSCDQAVFVDNNYVLSSFPTYKNSNGHLRIVSVSDANKVLDLPAESRIVDAKIVDNKVYILSETSFEAWDLELLKPLFKYKSHPFVNRESPWRELATGFILHRDLAVISHGILGISVIDLRTGNFLKTVNMYSRTAAQDIDRVNSNTAVLAVDNDTEAEFRGMYVFDLGTLEFTKQIKIDNAFPSAVRVLPNNRLMMIYFNAVWRFDLQSALASTEAQPIRRAWKFPNLYMVDMVGKVSFDEKKLYACFKTIDEKTGARKLVPLAMDLEVLKLN